VALRLSEMGMAVALNDVDATAAEQVADEISAQGRRSIAVVGSIADPAVCVRIVNVVVDQLGAVDVLVNNAGIASSGLPVHRSDPAELLALVAVHALGPFALCREVLPDMRARKFGRIIMISSEATRAYPPNSAPYTMAKAALEALARTLATENERQGIRVHVVAPGLVDTRLGELVVERLSRRGVSPVIATTPTDVAEVVARLVGANNDHEPSHRIAV
jgi:3-oxoacyl-[acyl-carrier protein] reductase